MCEDCGISENLGEKGRKKSATSSKITCTIVQHRGHDRAVKILSRDASRRALDGHSFGFFFTYLIHS